MSAGRCFICGRELDTIKPCLYNKRQQYTCDECCEECYRSEPFPCREYEQRKAQENKEESK